MGSHWSYGVTHYDKSNSWASQILKGTGINYTDELPLFTDTSGGTINSATIIIDARNGRFIRDQRAGETLPTKIDHNDRIRITMLDGVSIGSSYDRVFEVVRKIPIKTKGIGTQLRLECEGIERHIQKVKYTGRQIFTTPKKSLIELVAFYNENRTTDMPELLLGTNELPDSGVHHFDWGLNEETVYNRILELVDSQASAGSAGGVLDFFDFRIATSLANVTQMTIHVFSSGHTSASKPDVTVSATDVNTGETDGGIDEAEGTVIGAWGENGKGTLPTDYARFKARQQLMPTSTGSLFPEHDATITYPPLSIVQYLGATYWTPSTIGGTVPPSAPWKLLTPALYYGENNINNYGSANSVPQYSPWTQGKKALWENCGSGASGSTPFGKGFFDGNIILNDETTFRTWVHYRTTDSTIPIQYTYGEIGASGYWDGLRVLVDVAVPSAPFNGTDPYGVSYAKNIAEYDRELGEWVVKYDAFGTGTLDSMQVAVLNESRTYVWNNPTVGSWNDVTTSNNGHDWAHPWSTFQNTTSLLVNSETGTQFGAPNNNSALMAKYTWQPLESWTLDFFAGRNTQDYYQAGAWLSIMWPFPTNSLQLIAEDVGDIYGGGVQGSTGPMQPTFIDAQNMTWTHNGYRGFNIVDGTASSIEAEDYGQISSIDFLLKLKYEYTNAIGTYLLPKGNFQMRAWLIDRNDHVVFQDFSVPFNNETAAISLPLSGFQLYRGRRPRDLGFSLNDVFPPKGLPYDDIFEFHHIVAFCIGTAESYDTEKRYNAGIGGDLGVGIQDLLAFLSVVWSWATEINRSIEITIDALRFSKPLLAVTDSIDAAAPVNGITLVKTPDFLQHPDIGNYEQLKNIAKAELEKSQFKKTEYDITTEIRTDVEMGDYFYFEDDEIVDETDNGDNVVKLVAKHIEYSITKPIDGHGGALRRIRGSRRFV